MNIGRAPLATGTTKPNQVLELTTTDTEKDECAVLAFFYTRHVVPLTLYFLASAVISSAV